MQIPATLTTPPNLLTLGRIAAIPVICLFIALGWGWLQWLRGRRDDGSALRVARLGRRGVWATLLGAALLGEGVPAALIEQLPALEIISVFGVGYDGVDVAAAKARGVRFGQPMKLDAKQLAQCRRWRKEGMSYREIQALCKSKWKIELSPQTVMVSLKRKKR